MKCWICALAIGLCLVPSAWAADDSLPHLQKNGNITQLYVDAKPYVIFGGQVSNGSGFPDAMERAWPRMAAFHANTIEFPVYWEMIEPQEGQFDFSALDQIIQGAREHQFHLIPLWFGTWKNGAMDYVPDWVKTDPVKYPRVLDEANHPMNVLSPFGKTTLEADRTAFAALMKHLKDFDGTHHTVLMVQVENESGLLGSVRDYGSDSTKAFNGPVPDDLVKSLHKSPGTWKEVFGPRLAAESFTAWALSSYINSVAAAGKAQYPLLMYCNCWMGGDGTNDRFDEFDRPGDSYPSGGPVSHMLDLWKANAPNIDIIGPDIYHRSSVIYRTILGRYRRPDNPLMIVETGGGMQFARFCFYALADYNAIGFTSFGVDGPAALSLQPASPLAANAPAAQGGMTATGGESGRGGDAGVGPAFGPVASDFRLLSPAMDEIAQLQAAGKLKAAVEEDSMPGKMLYFDGYDLLVRFRPPMRVASAVPLQPNASVEPSGRVLVGQIGPDEFLIAGFDCALDFKPEQGSDYTLAQILRAERGTYENGQWKRSQILNGDLTTGGLRFPPEGAMILVKLVRI